MAGRPALISARFDGGEVEKRMREACKILKSRNCNVLMVEVAPGEDYGIPTALYLNKVRTEGGVLVAVCTEHYGEVTSSKFSSHHELLYAFTYGIEIIPLKMAATYPPQPAHGEAHPHDKDGTGEAVVSMAMPPSLLYEDCASSTSKQIADKIQARLGGPSVAPSAPRAAVDPTPASPRTSSVQPSHPILTQVAICYADGEQFWDDVSNALENPGLKTINVSNAKKALLLDAKIELFMRDNGFDIDAIRGNIAITDRRAETKSPWMSIVAGAATDPFGIGLAVASAGVLVGFVGAAATAATASTKVAAERYALTAALEGKGSFTLKFEVFERGDVSATLSIKGGSRGKA